MLPPPDNLEFSVLKDVSGDFFNMDGEEDASLIATGEWGSEQDQDESEE